MLIGPAPRLAPEHLQHLLGRATTVLAEFGFQRAEYRLKVGEGEVGAPQGGLVPSDFVAAQVVPTGMGHHRRAGDRATGRPGDRATREAYGGGALSGFIGVEFDVIVLSDAAAIFLEPTDALPDLVETFLGARFGQSFAELW